MERPLKEVIIYCEEYRYNSGGVDLTKRASPKSVRIISNLLLELGTEGHLLYSSVMEDLHAKPLKLCFIQWCEGTLNARPLEIVALIRAFLIGFTDFNPSSYNKVEGIVDPEVSESWWEQTHPRNIKRGRSDQGPRNKRRWKVDPDAPIEFDPTEV